MPFKRPQKKRGLGGASSSADKAGRASKVAKVAAKAAAKPAAPAWDVLDAMEVKEEQEAQGSMAPQRQGGGSVPAGSDLICDICKLTPKDRVACPTPKHL